MGWARRVCSRTATALPGGLRPALPCSRLRAVNGEYKRFYLIACRALWREVCFVAANCEQALDIQFLKRGLHDQPDLLRQVLTEEIAKADEDGYDAVLLAYGLCGRGIAGLRAGRIPLVIPRAHDCITLLLGSKERYRQYFAQYPGTYWYTPSWIETANQPSRERYEARLKEYVERYGEENGRYLMETLENWVTRYSRATYIDWGLGDNERYKRFTRECAQSLGWEYDELRGDPALLRDLCEGRWHEDRFLVVPPGHSVEPANDESVLVSRGQADAG